MNYELFGYEKNGNPNEENLLKESGHRRQVIGFSKRVRQYITGLLRKKKTKKNKSAAAKNTTDAARQHADGQADFAYCEKKCLEYKRFRVKLIVAVIAVFCACSMFDNIQPFKNLNAIIEPFASFKIKIPITRLLIIYIIFEGILRQSYNKYLRRRDRFLDDKKK